MAKREQPIEEKAEEAEFQKAEHEREKADRDGLVEMNKGDEVVRVHPSTVKSHQAAGWKLS